MIRVEINCDDVPCWAATNEQNLFPIYIFSRLEKAGIPIIGGPLLPQVDFTKGNLQTWDDYETGNKIFVWGWNENNSW